MSHEISIQNGRAEMVSASGKTPWHGLGTVVQGLMTSTEALNLAGLNWQVKGQPVTVNGKELPFPNGETADTWQGIVRQDTGDCLSIMRGRYTPIQNNESFDWFDALIGQGDAVYDTAGALRGGKQVWLLAKVDGIKRICGDEHRTYALLLNSHDGSHSLQCSWVTERVVCANTLAIAIAGQSNVVKIRHTKSWADKADEAKRILGIGNQYFDSVAQALETLGSHLLTPDQMKDFASLLVPAKDEASVPTRTANIRAEIATLFGTGAGNKAATRYDALQAVTDYADHSATLRGENSTRLESSIMGSGAQLKQRAFDLLSNDDVMSRLMARPLKVDDNQHSVDFARLIGQ